MKAIAKRLRTWGLLLVLALPLSSCGSEGAECDRCTSTSECAAGLTCAAFSDGSERCASGLGETSCRVR
jgi:hypothetical protein